MNQDYIEALHAAGAPRGIGLLELDRFAAELLKIDERTARRYRLGEHDVPFRTLIALASLAMRKGE